MVTTVLGVFLSSMTLAQASPTPSHPEARFAPLIDRGFKLQNVGTLTEELDALVRNKPAPGTRASILIAAVSGRSPVDTDLLETLRLRVAEAGATLYLWFETIEDLTQHMEKLAAFTPMEVLLGKNPSSPGKIGHTLVNFNGGIPNHARRISHGELRAIASGEMASLLQDLSTVQPTECKGLGDLHKVPREEN